MKKCVMTSPVRHSERGSVIYDCLVTHVCHKTLHSSEFPGRGSPRRLPSKGDTPGLKYEYDELLESSMPKSDHRYKEAKMISLTDAMVLQLEQQRKHVVGTPQGRIHNPIGSKIISPKGFANLKKHCKNSQKLDVLPFIIKQIDACTYSAIMHIYACICTHTHTHTHTHTRTHARTHARTHTHT